MSAPLSRPISSGGRPRCDAVRAALEDFELDLHRRQRADLGRRARAAGARQDGDERERRRDLERADSHLRSKSAAAPSTAITATRTSFAYCRRASRRRRAAARARYAGRSRYVPLVDPRSRTTGSPPRPRRRRARAKRWDRRERSRSLRFVRFGRLLESNIPRPAERP